MKIDARQANESHGECLTGKRVSRANRNKVKAGVSWVYMIQAGGAGPVKIGQTRELYVRLRALQAMHYEPLTLIGMIPETWATEAKVQGAFGASHIRGEWYRTSYELETFAAACLRVFRDGPVRTIPETMEAEHAAIMGIVLGTQFQRGARLSAHPDQVVEG